MTIGKLVRVPLREVWRHEAQDFTVWLQDNIDIINEAIDMNLSSAEREQSAGSFSVDIVAEDESGHPVIIENQLGKSDHDHLGKIITYLTNIGATAAIWIVETPRPEHVNAINWLNEASSGEFYLLKVEALRIGDSPPAPLLTLIVGPSEEGKEVGSAKKELKERHFIRRRFWTSLLEKAKTKTTLHANISPGTENWVSAGAGRYGLGYGYIILQNETRVELYIDQGKDSENQNKAIFDELFSAKDSIEEIFGAPLNWQRLDTKRACRISYLLVDGGYRDEERWPEIQDAMIDAMIRLERALKPRIENLKV